MSDDLTTDAEERHPLFLPVVLGGGFVFGFGLGISEMYQPEVVLSFLQLTDLGLLFVMGGAAVVMGVTILALSASGRSAPLTDQRYVRRLRTMDRNVLVGGLLFGVGNVPVLWAVAGMFLGAHLQGVLHSWSE